MQIANANIAIQVTGRHLAITDAIRDYTIKKVESLHLDTPKIIEAQVILEVQKKYRHIAEVVLYCANHITLEARAEANDLYAALDDVMAKIAQQMRKFKTRILRHNRPRRASIKHFNEKILSIELPEIPYLSETAEGAPAQVAPALAVEAAHVDEHKVLETESYRVKPMYVDEAILQLEISERDFVIFTNAQTEKTDALYRRKDGSFGLVELNAS